MYELLAHLRNLGSLAPNLARNYTRTCCALSYDWRCHLALAVNISLNTSRGLLNGWFQSSLHNAQILHLACASDLDQKMPVGPPESHSYKIG